MSQSYAIELYFDPALENQVLKSWNVLARRQISTQLMEIESRPHLTLLSSPNLEPSKLQSLIRNFAAKHEPVPITLSSIGSFSSCSDDSNSLFVLPTPSASLLDLHRQLCDSLKKDGVEIGENYLPDSWIPLCAVAEDVSRSLMMEAFCVTRDLKLPVTGYLLEIGVVEFPPVREMFSFTLGNVADS